jgi:hypothetical protein
VILFQGYPSLWHNNGGAFDDMTCSGNMDFGVFNQHYLIMIKMIPLELL